MLTGSGRAAQDEPRFLLYSHDLMRLPAIGKVEGSDESAARTIRGFRERRRSRPIVLATAGGGEDGRRLLDVFVEASCGAPWEAIAVTGPQLRPAEARVLRRRAGEPSHARERWPAAGLVAAAAAS